VPRGKALKSLRLIQAAADILREIQPATVRAVCYRLFTRGLIPDMSKNSTNRVGTQLVYAREQGDIPWSWIVDETREAERVAQWDDPEHYARVVQRSYRRDRWNEQPVRVEVWSEKGTVRGTLAPVLNRYGVAFRVMHGFASSTTAHEIAVESAGSAQPLQVLYVGDHDPSGLYMSEVDLPERLDRYGADLALRRLALTADDVRGGALPDYPAKETDTRHRWYVERYGRRAWELDALSPVVLRRRVEDTIRSLIAPEAWERAERVEAAERASLEDVLGQWKAARAA
jgi:hypothetical protein